jgi:hypothetical protein
MNLRHAAALALVGWYLMQSPGSYDSTGRWGNWKAPISKWYTLGSFDTAKACMAEMDRYDKAELAVRKAHPERKDPPGVEEWGCIATDDPRLKEK